MIKLILIQIALFFGLSFSASAQSSGHQYVEGEVIVKLKSEPGSTATYAFFGKAEHEKNMGLKKSYDKMRLYHYSTKPGKSVQQTLDELRQDPNVEYAEPNYYLSKKDLNGFEQTFSVPEIEVLAQSGKYLQTNSNIQATEIWQSLSVPASPPIVAVIDTGLDLTHPAFADSDSIWLNEDEIPNNGIDDDGNGYIDDVHGYNFAHNTGYMIDDDGHGTHVAGIILGVGQNIFNSPFPTSKIKIMPLKFLDASGVGTTSAAIDAIYYAVNNGAKVLNNSWGGPNYSGALHEAIVYTYSKGAAFVAASGNASSNNDLTPMYPASYGVPNVISVAATTDLDYLASFSNFGSSTVHVGSPGVFILSTIPGGGYGTMSGTSMATPFVSGIAALMLVESPQMMGYQIKQIILSESDSVVYLTNKVSTHSRVNVTDSVMAAANAAVDASQPYYSFTNQDRQLASALAGGGCGLVSKMYKDMSEGGKGGGPSSGAPGAWYIIIVLGLLSLPMLFVHYLRSQLPENKRKYKRFKIDSDVRVNIGNKELVGNISSISLGGVQLDTNELLESGSIVSMSISSPDGSEQIEVNGNIVWSESKKSYGVQFNEQTREIRNKITGWTKSLKPT